MTESTIAAVLQYGAMGLLAIVLLGGGRFALRLLEQVGARMVASVDAIGAKLDRLHDAVTAHESGAVQRAAELRERIDDSAKETRHSMRNERDRGPGE